MPKIFQKGWERGSVVDWRGSENGQSLTIALPMPRLRRLECTQRSSIGRPWPSPATNAGRIQGNPLRTNIERSVLRVYIAGVSWQLATYREPPFFHHSSMDPTRWQKPSCSAVVSLCIASNRCMRSLPECISIRCSDPTGPGSFTGARGDLRMAIVAWWWTFVLNLFWSVI